MWILGLCFVAALVIYYTHWIILWNNPKCKGVLPPGSMGLPLIGETLQMMIPSYSIDLQPFIKKRIQKYSPIFRTSVLGRPVVVSADPDLNSYILQQEGRSVEIWYMDTFSNVFGFEGESRVNVIGSAHKYMRSLVLNHLGVESIKTKLLPQLQDMMVQNLHKWSTQESVEVKRATSAMTFEFLAMHLFGYDAKKLPETKRISDEMFPKFLGRLLCFPLNIPGTTYHKCLQQGKKAFSIMKNILEEKRNSPEKHYGDFMDQAISDMETQKILTDDQIVYILLGIMFATFESFSSTLTLIFLLLSENPSVIEELRAEHEGILKSRNNSSSSSLTWDEYKSMNFTQQVINETLRLLAVSPGPVRKVLKDIQIKEYKIPAGWSILSVTAALHLNPKIYNDPLSFNPWRWKDLDSYTVSKNFMPFGGGLRQCVGAELARAFLATFLHVLVTKYRWTKIKGGKIVRNPILGFGDGIHIKLWRKAQIKDVCDTY